jgi:uncharacterized membrane protein SpoIIM required for sporulation
LTPLEFEASNEAGWRELEALLVRPERELDPERFLSLYRTSCEHLALAQARGFPDQIIDRLARLTARAHQIIYRQSEFGFRRITLVLMRRFPAMVRAHRGYVAWSALLFIAPLVTIGVATWLKPDLIYALVDPGTAQQYEEMYRPGVEAFGRTRNAGSDWAMFGFYIQHNVGISFQCYVTGVLFGLGSVYFLAYNGAIIGAIGGYITARGYGGTFFPFVATHSAFELTAIVLCGAAGLRIGHAVLMPGRLTRLTALQNAARDTSIIIFGAAVMLLIAAAFEAFWSSAAWVAPEAKFVCSAVCWTLVALVFLRNPNAS